MMTWRIIFCSILGTTTSIDIVGMHQDALHFLLSTNETCRTDDELPRTSNSVEGCHQNFQDHISAYHMCFGNFYPSFKKKKTLLVYLDCPAPCVTFSTTTKATLFGFKPQNSENTRRLFKSAKASVLESKC